MQQPVFSASSRRRIENTLNCVFPSTLGRNLTNRSQIAGTNLLSVYCYCYKLDLQFWTIEAVPSATIASRTGISSRSFTGFSRKDKRVLHRASASFSRCKDNQGAQVEGHVCCEGEEPSQRLLQRSCTSTEMERLSSECRLALTSWHQLLA